MMAGNHPALEAATLAKAEAARNPPRKAPKKARGTAKTKLNSRIDVDFARTLSFNCAPAPLRPRALLAGRELAELYPILSLLA